MRRSLRPLVCVAFCLWAGHAAAQSAYTFVAFDPPDSARFSPATDITNQGVVIGRAIEPGGFKWSESGGVQAPLVTSPDDATRFPSGGRLRINAGGTVMGSGCPNICGNPPEVPATWRASQGLVFLPLEDAGFGTANAINTGGAVAGNGRLSAAIWRPGQNQQTIPELSDAFDINDFEQVVGRCVGGPCGPAGSAATWTEAGGRTIIPRLPTHDENVPYAALAINNLGHVLGWYSGASAGVFYWSSSTGTVNLGAPSGPLTQAVDTLDINDYDQMVATLVRDGVGRQAFLYAKTTWIDLNTLVPSGTRMHLTRVNAINNSGWMVGSGTNFYPDDYFSGFVLIPPTVDITANEGDVPLVLHPGQSLRIGIEISTHGVSVVNPAELYIGVVTPAGFYWFTAAGLSQTPARLYAGPLPGLGPATLLDIPDVGPLPQGPYYWVAVVDADANGTLNADFFDLVQTTIVP